MQKANKTTGLPEFNADFLVETDYDKGQDDTPDVDNF